ncbi:MAG TPA: diguanylate cyclase [Myxococcota bacterium]|nr:diguanylate cyclase [Myxococcota bacterium]
MGETSKILVADDDPSFLKLLAETLGGAGYTVETAADGAQAMEKLRATSPDLLILDVMMPKMNGLEVCRIVKQSAEAFLPVILVTVKGDVDSKVTGLKLGADDYISKPFNPLELQARVASMLRIKSLQDKINVKRQELEALSVTDELTGLLNHRAMQQRLRDEFARAQRYNEPLSVVMLDVDHFKRINDTHGHQCGDRVLEKLGKVLAKSVRDIDIVARYGGDEFLVILPQTHFSGSLTVADRIWRAASLESVTTKKEVIQLTISVGVSFFPNKNISTVEELVHFADQALYQAKREGRNRICLHQHLNYMYRPDTAAN